MSDVFVAKRAPRVIFFGMQSYFSVPCLRALLRSAIEVCAVVIPMTLLPGQSRSLPVIERREPPSRRPRRPLLAMMPAGSDIVDLAWQNDIPLWEVHRLAHPETLAILAGYQADVICVACFPQRVPPALLNLPRLGCLNVHPSLLPANRGPLPLFWTFYEGDETTGVTIHLMNERMDSGDILAQQEIRVRDGMRYEELEVLCTRLGGELLARTVHDLYEGRVVRVPQDEARSSSHSFPTDGEFVISAREWSARRVYNFIRGSTIWDRPVIIVLDGRELVAQDATSYSLDQEMVPMPGDAEEVGGEMMVSCKDGWVRVKLAGR
ncbi:MAG: methionyl-tRNA formyltransferase [Ktedonobacteraceae bacterium]|nr:methionyl-tRNA formyltransferase [Ktedonobacteraceae bacterium]